MKKFTIKKATHIFPQNQKQGKKKIYIIYDATFLQMIILKRIPVYNALFREEKVLTK